MGRKQAVPSMHIVEELWQISTAALEHEGDGARPQWSAEDKGRGETPRGEKCVDKSRRASVASSVVTYLDLGLRDILGLRSVSEEL